MTKEQRIAAELHRLARVATGISVQYAAHLELHRAAAMTRDRETLIKERDNLHTLLDSALDNQESIQLLANEAHGG